jgi:hypothetical protein
MSTQAQIDANRDNAQHSTGPTTADGTAVAAQNSYKHGLRSRSPLAPGEDPAEYTAYALELMEDLKPVGMAQRVLAEQIAQLQWKLRRVPEAEWVELETYRARNIRRMQQETGKIKPPMPPGLLLAANLDRMMTLQVYEARIHRAIDQAHRQLRQLQQDAAERAKQEPAESTSSPAARPQVTERRVEIANSSSDQPLAANWVRLSEPAGDASPPSPDAKQEVSA